VDIGGMTSAGQTELKEKPIAQEFLLSAALRHESQARKVTGIKLHKQMRTMIEHCIFSLYHSIRSR
jgi:hypothetical protein